MIIPGTTISLTLNPTSIEVRDKGLVKKKLPLTESSFDDVALELQKYLRYLGKRLAPGVLEDVLVRIGLPKTRRVLQEELMTPPEPEGELEQEVVAPPSEPEGVLEPEVVDDPEPKKKKRRSFLRKKEKPATPSREGQGVSADEKGTITSEDFDDITDALQAVEALSDSFMSGAPKEKEKPIEPQPKISIHVSGQEEIIASNKSYARSAEIEEIPDVEEEPADELIELVRETVEKESLEEEFEPAPLVIPTHQIKPVVVSKGLLLGEDGVGKQELKAKAGVVPITLEDGEKSSYIFGKVFEGDNHRIDLRVWSFDLAVKAKVQRKQFYLDSQIIIIVYAASDRWSFESIDFWLREATLSSEKLPPIVIVANKIDLRIETANDSGDQPVSYNEGFQLAEDLAKRFGEGDNLHPVAFIETSCVTDEGVEDVFRTAIQLFENTLQT